VTDRTDTLRSQLADELGGEITDLARLSAGASRETWTFSVDTQPLILQRNRTGTLSGSIDEPALLRHARAGRVTVPEVVCSSSTGDHPIGPSFAISRRVDGESIARKILRDDEFAVARDRFVADCASELAAIHALDPTPVAGFLDLLEDPVDAQRTTFDMIGDPHPVFELAFRWLDEHRPPMGEPTVVHGDFRMGNFLIGPTGMTAVLDWELAHRGDPIEDLGWLCARAWRFGGAGDVGGLGSREELIEAYAAAGGRDVSLDALRWWEVLATLRWGVITMFMGAEYRSGASPSMEQAAIGRRVVENEYDVLLLLLPELVG
jgi:aminoglycoside phosphotransferase (APT) family kinase protein